MANETWKFVQAKSKQAMKQALGIRDEKARMKVTPPLAVASIAQEDGMRWNQRGRRRAALHISQHIALLLCWFERLCLILTCVTYD